MMPGTTGDGARWSEGDWPRNESKGAIEASGWASGLQIAPISPTLIRHGNSAVDQRVFWGDGIGPDRRGQRSSGGKSRQKRGATGGGSRRYELKSSRAAASDLLVCCFRAITGRWRFTTFACELISRVDEVKRPGDASTLMLSRFVA
jgi:hypothetical protein